MKIFTLRARTLLPLAAVGGALLLGLAAVFLVPPVQSAFSSTSGRQLPIYSVQTDEKKAALGINCAWDDADILPMISTLQEYDVKATFFLLGEWAAKYPAAARTIALAGQEIGSHANTHRDLDRGGNPAGDRLLLPEHRGGLRGQAGSAAPAVRQLQ